MPAFDPPVPKLEDTIRNLKREIAKSRTFKNLPVYRNFQGRNNRADADLGKEFQVIIKRVGSNSGSLAPLVINRWQWHPRQLIRDEPPDMFADGASVHLC
jgi:hypothetical protein